MSPSADEMLLQTLERSRLLAFDEWAVLRRELDGPAWPDTSEDVLVRLTRRGWITPWQEQMLREGRTGFFLGKYKLLECIGTGATGHVFRAQHTTMERVAAIKVLSPTVVKNRHAVARFQKEVQAAAALDSPYIVGAYDAESVGDVHFLVMEYIQGRNLNELVMEHGRLPMGWSCECIRQAALGLQHAHEQRMVHRDIKPSNLLVTRGESGRPMVKVLDLGLARFVSESVADGLTQTGQVLGTPDYISPEQAADTRRADIRSDIFSLGCSLFRILTGTVPFGGTNVMEKLMARANSDAPDIRTLRPEIPAGLAAVIAQMLDRVPARRPQTPQEVALALKPFCDCAGVDPLASSPEGTRRVLPAAEEDGTNAGDCDPADSQLDRFLQHLASMTGEDATRDIRTDKPDKPPATVPVAKQEPPRAAAPAPSVEQGFVQIDTGVSLRRPAVEAPWYAPRSLALSVAPVVALASVMWIWSLIQGSTRPQPNPDLPPVPKQALALLTLEWPARDRTEAKLTWDGEPQPLPLQGPVTVRGVPGRHVLKIRRPGYEPVDAEIVLSVKPRSWTPIFKADGTVQEQTAIRDLEARFAALPVPRTAERETDLRARCVDFLGDFPNSPARLQAVRLMSKLHWPLDRLSRDQVPRPELAAAGASDRVPLELVGVFGDSRLRHWSEVRSVAVNAQGTLIASSSLDGTVRVWETTTGNLRHRFPVGDGRVQLVFTPHEPWLITAVENRDITLWELQQGELKASLNGGRAPMALSPDGQWLLANNATGSADTRGTLGLWNVESGTMQGTIARQEGVVEEILFSPNGELAAVWLNSDLVQLCDMKSLAVRHTLSNARRPRFRPREAKDMDDATPVVAVELTGDERGHDLALYDALTGAVKRTLDEAGEPLAFLPGSDTLASVRTGRVILWNLTTGNELRTLRDTAERLVVSPDRRWLAAGDAEFGTVQFWDLTTGAVRQSLRHSGGISDLVFTPDSTQLVTASADHSLKLWNVEQGAELQIAGHAVGPIALSPDGKTLVFASDDGSLRLRDVVTGKSSRTLEDAAQVVRRLAYSPNGRHIACIGDWGFFQFTLRLWDASSGNELELPGGTIGTIRAFAFSPDSRRLATASGNSVVVWNLETRQPEKVLDDLSAETVAVAFGPNNRIAIACRDRTILLWDSAGSAAPVTFAERSLPLTELAFSPTGDQLAAGTELDRIELWDLSQGAAHLKQTLISPGRFITSLVFAPDGTQLVAANDSGRVHLWPLSGGAVETAPAQTLTLGPAGGKIGQVLISPEGRHLMTVNGNGTVYVLRLTDVEE